MKSMIKRLISPLIIGLCLLIPVIGQAKATVLSLLGIGMMAVDYVNPYTEEGQRAMQPKMGETWSWFIISLVLVLLIAIALLIMIRIKINQFIERQRLKELGEDEYYEKASWWEVFVKTEKDKPLDAPIEGHNYDGIVELDNNPPAWFNWLFFLPIIWGIFYVMYYHVLDLGKLQEEEYVAEMKVAEEKAPELEFIYAELSPLTEPSDLENGLSIYQAKCASCHGPEGGGSVGPNLTDKYWIHGGDYASITQTIYEGVDGKGMAAWGEFLLTSEVEQVASFIHSELRNTNVPDGKAPEGEEYNP